MLKNIIIIAKITFYFIYLFITKQLVANTWIKLNSFFMTEVLVER